MKKIYPPGLLIICICCFTALAGWKVPGSHVILHSSSFELTPPVDTPHGLIGNYYIGQEYETYRHTRIDSILNFNWNTIPPYEDIGHDNYSVQWIGFIKAPFSGVYTFHTNTDDGSYLMINGLDIIDYWGSCCRDHSGQIYLDSGKLYPIIMGMHQGGGGANVYLKWEAPGLALELVPNEALYAVNPSGYPPAPDVSKDTAHGLVGRYYNDPSSNTQWFDTLVATRIDPQINFDWGSYAPIDGVVANDNFSVRWSGFLWAPVSGTYTFHTWTDDGSRLLINGQDIIDYWGTCCSDHSGTIDLEAGKVYSIVLEYHEIGGGSGAHYINWEAPGLSLQNIPSSDLYTVPLQPVSPPVISPTQGIYEDSVGITLSSSTPGADIHYTLNGSNPGANSPLYTDTIWTYRDTTIKAIAFHDGMITSPVVSASYRVIPTRVPQPVFTPPPGVYYSPQAVTMSDRLDSVSIYYTVDGSNPNKTSALFNDSLPLQVDSTMIIKAYGVKDTLTPSGIYTGTYIIVKPGVKAPVFSIPGGKYSSSQKVTIADSTSGAVIYYTVDGRDPDISSPVYSSPIQIDTSTILKAFAAKQGMEYSQVTSATYLINQPEQTVDTPVFSIPSGSYHSIQQVSLTTNTRGAIIYFTTDGSTPDSNSSVFQTPITVADTATIKTFAWKEGMNASPVVSATYLVAVPPIDKTPISTKLPVPKLNISPNPASDMVRLSWEGLIYTQDRIRIFITDGKGSMVKDITIPNENAYFEFSTKYLSGGVYYIRVQSGNSEALGKLIVSH